MASAKDLIKPYEEPSRCDLMVFTDLDGTLIDHNTYCWDAALPALSMLKARSAAIIMASSKTAAEIGVLRDQIGIAHWPAIVENGAGILPPNSVQLSGNEQYRKLRAILAEIPLALRSNFSGFGDMTTAEVAELTALSLEHAELAKQRGFSEPGLWAGPEDQRDEFLARLLEQGVVAQQGGRFLTLSFGRNKVDQMRALIEKYRPKQTVALGDAPNDIAMLEFADYGVIVANPDSAPLRPLNGEADGSIIRTRAAGPSGWNEAMFELSEQLNLQQDP